MMGLNGLKATKFVTYSETHNEVATIADLRVALWGSWVPL